MISKKTKNLCSNAQKSNGKNQKNKSKDCKNSKFETIQVSRFFQKQKQAHFLPQKFRVSKHYRLHQKSQVRGRSHSRGKKGSSCPKIPETVLCSVAKKKRKSQKFSDLRKSNPKHEITASLPPGAAALEPRAALLRPKLLPQAAVQIQLRRQPHSDGIRF